MVGTRNSLPNVASFNPSSDDPNVPKELRRLNIDGKDTMRGIKIKQPKNTEILLVYHWRGAAYEVTDDTPQEWLDQDPEYRKRKARIMKARREAAEAEERAAAGNTSTSSKKTLKRKSTGNIDTDTNNSDNEEEDDMARPAKRARRNTVHNGPTTTTRLRKPSATASSNPRRRSTRLINDDDDDDAEFSTLKFDFTQANAQRVRADLEAKKQAAVEKGYNLNQYTDEELDELKRQKEAQRESEAPRIPPPPPQQATPGLSTILARDIVKMAKLNAVISKKMAEYEKAKNMGVYKALLARKNTRLAGGKVRRPRAANEDEDGVEVVSLHNGVPAIAVEQTSDDELQSNGLLLTNAFDEVPDERDTQSQRDSQLNYNMNENDDDEESDTDPLSLPTNTIRDSQPLRSDSDVSDDHSSKRQDSATSATSPELPPSSHTTPTGDFDAVAGAKKMSPAAYELPEKNRGGQKLRWSLGGDASPNGVSKTRRFSGEGRAETLIHKGRMNGESKSARRRRVQREMKILHSWPIDEEETAKLRAAAAARGEF